MLIRKQKASYALSEKKILIQLNHPNIIKLYSTFQDKHSLCIFFIYFILFISFFFFNLIYLNLNKTENSYFFILFFLKIDLI